MAMDALTKAAWGIARDAMSGGAIAGAALKQNSRGQPPITYRPNPTGASTLVLRPKAQAQMQSRSAKTSSVKTAPASVSYTERYDPDTAETTIRRRIPLGSVRHVGAANDESFSTIDGINVFNINAGNTKLFHWAGDVGALYSEGCVQSLSVELQPTLPTNTAGRYGIAYQPKVTATVPDTWDKVTEFKHISTSVWEGVKLPLPLKKKWMTNVDTNSVTHTFTSGAVFDPADYFNGRIQFFDTANAANGDIVARAYLEMVIKFRSPRPSAAVPKCTSLHYVSTADAVNATLTFPAGGTETWVNKTGPNMGIVATGTAFTLSELPPGNYYLFIWHVPGTTTGTGLSEQSIVMSSTVATMAINSATNCLNAAGDRSEFSCHLTVTDYGSCNFSVATPIATGTFTGHWSLHLARSD